MTLKKVFKGRMMLHSKFILYVRIWLLGKKIGEDEYGNVYYESRRLTKDTGRKKRWALIKGHVDPSKIPAHWHGWLHYTHPFPAEKPTYAWSKPHLPNLTGTPYFYQKSQVPLHSAHLQYAPWTPQEQNIS